MQELTHQNMSSICQHTLSACPPIYYMFFGKPFFEPLKQMCTHVCWFCAFGGAVDTDRADAIHYHIHHQTSGAVGTLLISPGESTSIAGPDLLSIFRCRNSGHSLKHGMIFYLFFGGKGKNNKLCMAVWLCGCMFSLKSRSSPCHAISLSTKLLISCF